MTTYVMGPDPEPVTPAASMAKAVTVAPDQTGGTGGASSPTTGQIWPL